MFFLRFCLLVAILLTIAPQVPFLPPVLSAFEGYSVQFGIGSLVLAAILARRHRVWALAGVLVAAWSAYLVLPTVMPARSKAPVDAPSLKVVTLNIWDESPRLSDSIAYLQQSGADLIGLSEVTPQSKAMLAALRATYPYSVDCVRNGSICNVMLLSKLPITNAFGGDAGGRLTYVARGEIEWQGRTITVTAAHLFLPFVREDWAPAVALVPPDDPRPELPGAPPRLWQSQQAAVLAAYLRTAAPDRVVIGDFNSVAWGKLQGAFRRATGLDNRGFLAPSWTTRLPWPMRIPIDHVFVGGALAVRSLHAGPNTGSDHSPIEAEIVLKP